MNITAYKELLEQCQFYKEEMDYLVNGFQGRVYIGYEGPHQITHEAPNLKLDCESSEVLWVKMMKVLLKLFAGLFKEIPFKNYIQSPVGLVSKGMRVRQD